MTDRSVRLRVVLIPIISPQPGLTGGSDLDEQRVIVEPDCRSAVGDDGGPVRRDVDDDDDAVQ
jgi:hypothetical protein